MILSQEKLGWLTGGKWSKKNYSRINFQIEKKIGFNNIELDFFHPQNILFPQFFMSTVLGPKNVWPQKHFVKKKFSHKKNKGPENV